MDSKPLFVVASPDHPSLQPHVADAVERFATALRSEQRYFGRPAATGSKPLPSMIRRVVTAEPAIRVVATTGGDVIGMGTIDLDASPGPELLLAVAQPWRGRGVATELARSATAAAGHRGIDRTVVRTCPRVPALLALGRRLGWTVVDGGRGRVELVAELAPRRRSA